MEISFSYIITFISLIYGLALAHSLSCIAEYIQHWNKIKHYWVWWFWAIFLILLSVGFWISIYALYSKTDNWIVSHFFFLTLQSALFYLTYYIFFNHYDDLENSNLQLEYYKYKRVFFILLSIQFILMFFGHNLLATDKSITTILMQNFPILIYSICLIVLAFINNQIVHKVFAIFFLFMFITVIALDSF